MQTRIISTLLFALVLIGCVSWILVRTTKEAQRANYLSQLSGWSSDTPAAATTSLTGYQGGQRISMVPGHHKQGFGIIATAQQMIAQKKFRVDHIDYANASIGHPTHFASVYPWLLATVASAQRQDSSQPMGQSVEVAAQKINSFFLLAGLLTLSIGVAHCFGFLPAALLAIGLATCYPFTGAFLAGTPNALSLHALFSLCGVMALIAGASASEKSSNASIMGAPGNHFAIGGIFSALALWLDVPAALPFIGGVSAAGILIALFSKAPNARSLPWRTWSAAGAATVMIGYFSDYVPSRGHAIFRSIHPLYALAWIGLGEIAVQCGKIKTAPKPWISRRIIFLVAAVIAFLQLPVALFHTHADLYAVDGPDSFRLDPNSNIAAPSIVAWLSQEGLSLSVTATVLPLFLIPVAVFLLIRLSPTQRLLLALALGPLVPILLVGARQLSYLAHLDVMVMTVIVVLVAALNIVPLRRTAFIISGLFLLSLSPSLYREFRPAPSDVSLSSTEFEAFIERDLAHWLRQHFTSTPAVLAPPRVISALSFYGGIKGLGTFDRDNNAGTAAAIRIVSASSAEEAFNLIDARKLTHIIIPFWDAYLEQYLRLGVGDVAGSDRVEQSFLATLKRWQLPSWLRALPYRLPPGPGVDGNIVIFEVVDDQPPAVAAARLVEYFLEMDQLENAREKARELTQYPSDLGALAAACAAAAAMNDPAGLEQTRARLVSALEKSERRRLFWDRRVSLAIVLAQQKQSELAKLQLGKCLEEINAGKLQSLTTISLYRFALLCKLYGMEIDDPALKDLSMSLLRPDLRARL